MYLAVRAGLMAAAMAISRVNADTQFSRQTYSSHLSFRRGRWPGPRRGTGSKLLRKASRGKLGVATLK